MNPPPPPPFFFVSSSLSPCAGALGGATSILTPPFMPIFTASGNGGIPATAALAQVSTTQAAGVPIPSLGIAIAGTFSIPGFAAVPAKLVQRIWALEYVDMWELLPETWRLETAERGCCHAKRTKCGLITDISHGTECFTTLAATLSVRYPQSAPQLMAYLRTIVRASHNFEGSAWVIYDTAYRRQAANNRRLDWATTDPALYNVAFTGRAKAIPRCRFCLADSHQSQECIFAPEETKLQCMGQQPPWRGSATVPVAQICRLFNWPGGNACRFRQCRYAHLCARCNRPHPVSECDRRQPARRPRSPSPTVRPERGG